MNAPANAPARAIGHDPYARQLTDAEIAAGGHRASVGGLWDEIGQWQFDLLCRHGLRPADYLLDIGCGALRGGVHFIPFLDPGHYYGIDRNESLLKGGRGELAKAGCADRQAHLLVNGEFEFQQFGAKFTFALAQSVFTHLPANLIERCLVKAAQVLSPGGKLFATYFDAPHRYALEPIARAGAPLTYSDRDPYHYHLSTFEYLASGLPLRLEKLDEPGHLRRQSVLVFHRI